MGVLICTVSSSKFKLAVDVRQDGVSHVFLCSVSTYKRNREVWEAILNVSQKFGVSCFLRLSLSNFVQILVGESTRYTDRSYVFQPFSFENLPHFN